MKIDVTGDSDSPSLSPAGHPWTHAHTPGSDQKPLTGWQSRVSTAVVWFQVTFMATTSTRFHPNLCSRENWARIDRVNGFHSCELYPLKSLITTNNWTLAFRLILKAHFCQLGIPRNDFKVLSEGALRIINFLPVSPQPGVCLGSAPSPTTKPWTNCENPNVMTQRHCFRNTTLSFCF